MKLDEARAQDRGQSTPNWRLPEFFAMMIAARCGIANANRFIS
jgi:hypothetical protein